MFGAYINLVSNASDLRAIYIFKNIDRSMVVALSS